jgi:hypothetical protein
LVTGLGIPDIWKTLTSRTGKFVSQLNSQNICGTYWRLSDLPGSSEIEKTNVILHAINKLVLGYLTTITLFACICEIADSVKA